MPNELYAVAGSTIDIGGVLASKSTPFTAADFSGQTWTPIDGWETMGALGDSSEAIKTALINRGRMVKQKGVADAGSYECKFVRLDTDPGQIALRAARGSQSNYAFRVTYPNGTTERFIGLVMSGSNEGGSANTVLMLTVTIEVNSNVVIV